MGSRKHGKNNIGGFKKVVVDTGNFGTNVAAGIKASKLYRRPVFGFGCDFFILFKLGNSPIGAQT